jgi:tRNA-dihydrouridine synthase
MAEWKGERSALLEMRKHFAWYTAGRRNSAQVRTKVNLAGSFEEVEALLRTLDDTGGKDEA